jgi:hypothetical protein
MNQTLSIKVSKEMKTRLRAIAKSRHTKPSALIREALQIVVSASSQDPKPSLYELSKDLFEDLGRHGPRDLSTNPKHLTDLGK